jgi:type VII secretion protein EccB
MQTRRDQLQAHRFVTRRIVSAMLSGEPETTERPMRRFGLAVFGSAMVAAIIFAGVGVVGFLFPSGAKLADPSIVIERETGARYVFVDGQLHPVLNFASARLLLGSDAPQVMRVSAKSLSAYPRGRAVGIANLPDPLPDRKALADMSWSACSLRRAPGSAEFATHLLVGSAPSGGEALADRSLLVAAGNASGTTMWLLADGRRFLVGTTALAPLGLAAAKPAKVTNSVIDGIPPGPELAVPKVDERGRGGQFINAKGTNIGQLFEAAGQHYVLLRSGLATVGPLMLKLLFAVDTRVTSIPANEATANRSKTQPTFDPPGFPTELPPAAYTDAEPDMVCTQAPTGAAAVTATAPDVVIYPRLTTPESTEQAPSRTGPDGVRLADRIVVPSGSATLVRTLAAPGDTTPNTTTYLVTDQGVRYALPRVDTGAVLASLGYGGVEPTPVPTFLLSLMPAGPALDPAAARLYVDETVPETTPTPTTTPTPSRSAG